MPQLVQILDGLRHARSRIHERKTAGLQALTMGVRRWPGQSPQPDLEGSPRRKNEWFAGDDWALGFNEVLG
jgi:hypothetical protein